jgi:hypothetical protein
MSTIYEEVVEHLSAIYITAKDEIHIWYQHAKEIWVLLALLLLLLIGLIWFARPAPPHTVYMATGEGSYRVLGEKYREYFKQKGINLELVPTKNSKDNLRHLIDRNDPIQAAFVQGGMIDPKQTKGLLSLGSVDYEPVWVFYRPEAFEATPTTEKKKLRNDLKLSIEKDSEGFQIMALKGLPSFDPHIVVSSNLEGEQQLYKGEVDALVVVDGFDSPIVQRLIHRPDIHLASFTRADAYTRLLPFLEKLSIPTGGFDLAVNNPNHQIDLVSTTTNLLIDDRLHPAIQLLLLEAAREINGGRSYFARAGTFPKYIDSDVPLSKDARFFYENGPPSLNRYLPFWLAEFLERMFLLLVPFVAFAYPILKAIPNYRLNLARKQINEIYKELNRFEHETLRFYDANKRIEYLKTLDEIEKKVLNSSAAKIATADCYTLRNNIQYIRESIDKEAIYAG